MRRVVKWRGSSIGCHKIALGQSDAWFRVGEDRFDRRHPEKAEKVRQRQTPNRACKESVWNDMKARRDRLGVQKHAIEKAKSKMLKKGKFARIDHGVMKGRDFCNRTESLAVQYFALEKYPDSVRTYTYQHSGCGQIQLGPTAKRHVDQVLVFDTPDGVEWLCINIHEFGSHCVGPLGHKAECKRYKGVDPTFNEDTKMLDRFNTAYCEHITRSGFVRMKYSVMTECDLWHGNALKVASKGELQIDQLSCQASSVLLDSTKTDKEFVRMTSPENKEEFKTMMFRLQPEDFVARQNFMTGIKTESDMLNHITRSEIDGFVTICGGVELADDLASQSMAYCISRSLPQPDELGEGFYILCRQMAREKFPWLEGEALEERTREIMEKRCSSRITMTRKNFPHPVTISMSYLRWLIKERKLSHFSILHVYAYRYVDF